MNIESQLVSVLDERIREKETKRRNIELIAYIYGFRGEPSPTYEQAAEQYSVGSRERVRQILVTDFKKVLTSSDLPELGDWYELIRSRHHWLLSDLRAKILEAGLAGDNFPMEGILKLLADLGISKEYGIYLPELEEQNRQPILEPAERFVIDKSVVSEIRPLFRQSRRLPGRYGISCLDYLDDGSQNFATNKSLIQSLIENSQDSWTCQDNDALWYVFEDIDDNVLVNFSKKVFSLVQWCDSERLAVTYFNAFRARPQRFDFPPVDILAAYLSESRRFEKSGHQVRYLGEKDRSVSPIEKQLFQYLQENGPATYPNIKSHLSSLNYSEALVSKSVMTSPFVFVDRTGGRHNHLYGVVGTVEEPIPEDRYSRICRRLSELANTDEPTESKRRREQGILREWLFEGKSRENCAICSESYPVTALVAAHKKKRKDCSDSERRDPYIVMPLCVFGCDFLYEEGFVRVNDGKIQEGVPFDDAGNARHYLEKVINRILAEEWTRGPASYFCQSTSEHRYSSRSFLCLSVNS